MNQEMAAQSLTPSRACLSQFYTYNPGIETSCSSLWLGYYAFTSIMSEILITTKTLPPHAPDQGPHMTMAEGNRPQSGLHE
jgi:hypothetical protein